jgi:hypothetical protein
LGAVQAAAAELVKRSASGTVDAAEAVKALDGMMTRVEALKRKVRPLTPSLK